MNIVDLIIFLIMSTSMVVGLYNGFVLSAMHAAAFFLTWVISVILYPIVTRMILGTIPSLLNTITLYAEGSAQIPNIEDKLASIHTVPPETVSEIVEQVQLPNPFSRILIADFSQTLEGIQTLGDYFDTTMALVIINIFSLLVLFFLVKVIFVAIVSITKTVADLPVLKKHDGIVGAGFGLVRGLFVVYLVFALIPVLLVLAPTDIINDFLGSSKLSGFFQHTNIFTSFVRGW